MEISRTVIKSNDEILHGNIGVFRHGDDIVGVFIKLVALEAVKSRNGVVKLHKEILSYLKDQGCVYAFVATSNPLMAIALAETGVARIFDENKEEVKDVDAFIKRMEDAVKTDEVVCEIPEEQRLDKGVHFSFPILGEAKPPFVYLEHDEHGNVLKVSTEKPTGTYIIRSLRSFVPGDEEDYSIIINEDGSITSILRDLGRTQYN